MFFQQKRSCALAAAFATAAIVFTGCADDKDDDVAAAPAPAAPATPAGDNGTPPAPNPNPNGGGTIPAGRYSFAVDLLPGNPTIEPDALANFTMDVNGDTVTVNG